LERGGTGLVFSAARTACDEFNPGREKFVEHILDTSVKLVPYE
jgi:hypothetical protein